MSYIKIVSGEKKLILIITILGALIRFYIHFNRDFYGDEIGTLKWIEKDILYLLSHFKVWLTMNYFIVLEKIILLLFQGNRISLLFVPMIAGILTIPLTAVLARKYLGSTGAILVTIFVAFNPFLIRYSGIIRSYSLMTMFSIIVIVIFNNWNDNKKIRNGLLLSLFSYLLVITHPNGIYVIICIAFFAIYDLIKNRFNILLLKRYLTMIIPLFVALVLIYFSYIKIFPEMFKEGEQWHVQPPAGVNYASTVINMFFSEGFFGWISLFIILFGLYKAISNNNKIVQLLPFIFTPILFFSVQGLDHYPWAFARMLIFTLPLYLIFMAYGLTQLTETSKTTPRGYLISILTVIIILSWTPNFIRLHNKFNSSRWKTVSIALKKNRTNWTLFIANEWITKLHLSQYMSNEVITLDMLNINKYQNKGMYDIYFIYTTGKIISSMDYKQYGDIKIIRYTDVDIATGLEFLRTDLAQTTINYRVNPDFTDFYRNLLKLNSLLGYKENPTKYLELYLKSQQLTRRWLNMPVSQKINYWKQE